MKNPKTEQGTTPLPTKPKCYVGLWSPSELRVRSLKDLVITLLTNSSTEQDLQPLKVALACVRHSERQAEFWVGEIDYALDHMCALDLMCELKFTDISGPLLALAMAWLTPGQLTDLRYELKALIDDLAFLEQAALRVIDKLACAGSNARSEAFVESICRAELPDLRIRFKTEPPSSPQPPDISPDTGGGGSEAA